MTYLVLVSHGTFAYGLHDTLEMFSSEGDPTLISCCLEKGMDADVYMEKLKEKLSVINPETDRMILMADLQGGSPLTHAMEIVSEMGLLEGTPIYVSMNLPLALNAVLQKDSYEFEEADETFMDSAEVRRFVLEDDDDDEI